MTDTDFLTARFEDHRDHLRAVAYRMLGSSGEADDAVQETWLRLARTDMSEVRNLGGWLTTVIGRICLDMLRSRQARRHDSLDDRHGSDLSPGDAARSDVPSGPEHEPEHEAQMVDSVGRALLVVLDRLGPAERLAFVLHDMFAVPFDQVATVVDRSPSAAKKLASRARSRVRGTSATSSADIRRQREVVEAFFDASRRGSFQALLALLAPDVVLRMDETILPGGPTEVTGAEAVAEGALVGADRNPFAAPALIDGVVGIIVAPAGRLHRALVTTVVEGRITRIDLIGDPARLDRLEIAPLDLEITEPT